MCRQPDWHAGPRSELLRRDGPDHPPVQAQRFPIPQKVHARRTYSPTRHSNALHHSSDTCASFMGFPRITLRDRVALAADPVDDNDHSPRRDVPHGRRPENLKILRVWARVCRLSRCSRSSAVGGTRAVQLIWTSRQRMTPPGNARLLVRFLRGQFCQNAAFRLVRKLFNFQAFEIDFRHGGYASGLCEFAIDL
jgi:hypothetical protein